MGDDEGAGPTDDADGLEARLGRALLPPAIRRRYAAKFFLSLSLVVIVIATVGLVGHVQIQETIQRDAENTLESTAQLQADSVADWTAGMRTQTVALASARVFDRRQAAIEDFLDESLASASEDVVDVHYVNRTSGEIVASTAEGLAGRQVGDVNPGLQTPVEKLPAFAGGDRRVTMSDTAYESRGDIRMAFASRTGDGHGAIVVVGDVRADFRQVHQTRDVVTTKVLNADGQAVLGTRQNAPEPVADTTEFRVAVEQDRVATLHRETEVVAFAPVPQSEWVVATTAPKSALFQVSREVGDTVVVLVLISLLSLSVVGIVLGRQTVNPLVRLRRRAEAMEEGDLEVDLSTGRVDEIGQLYRAFASMRDALRAQIEAAERAREEAEASRRELQRKNERLDQFASTVSHDLRNPLTVARGNLELVAMELRDLATETEQSRQDVIERVETVDQAHDRIESIIEDVLALARGGDTIESTAPCDLGTVAREAWDTVETGDATLDVVDTGTLEADREQLRRALENLFRNASEHAGPAPTVEVGLTDRGFYVADDGPGVPDSEAGDVFTHGHTTSEEGTGLGLAIVETIASAHGWDVQLDREYDEGARFVFTGVFDSDS